MTAARMLTVALGVLALCSFSGSAGGASTRTLPAIHVSGKRLLNSSGRVVHLHGVNRSGSEYACIQGWGIFDGPSDAASVTAIASWPVSANCFLRGGPCGATFNNTPYKVAGMQQAVTVMRRAGCRGVISIPGIDYAYNLSEWLSHRPRDSRHQLVAEAHIYGKNTCSSTG